LTAWGFAIAIGITWGFAGGRLLFTFAIGITWRFAGGGLLYGGNTGELAGAGFTGWGWAAGVAGGGLLYGITGGCAGGGLTGWRWAGR
jgi:hypothetical protein